MKGLIILFILIFPNICQAVNFDGSNDYIDMGDVLDLGTADTTITIWLKTSQSITDVRGVIGKHQALDVIGRYGMYLSSGAAHKIRGLADLGANTYVITSTSNIDDQLWHFIVIVLDRDDLFKLYFDGVLESSVDISSYSGSDIYNALPFNIAPYLNSSGNPADYFPGEINDARLYRRALSVEEIQELYTGNMNTNPNSLDARWRLFNTNDLKDLSGNGNDGTNNGTTDSSIIAPLFISGGGI